MEIMFRYKKERSVAVPYCAAAGGGIQLNI